MSWRSITLGVLLGLAISTGAYFNDHVIQQTYLIGNSLPPAVFGVGLLLLLVANPLLRTLGPDWPLRPAELAVILALGSAVCAWPGSNLFRIFTQLVALPSHDLQTRPSWQSAQVMSYVPGGSPALTEAFVHDWAKLVVNLQKGARLGPKTLAGRIWQQMPDESRQLIRNAGTSGHIQLSAAQRQSVLAGLNRVIASTHLYDAKVFVNLRLPAHVQGLIKKSRDHHLGPWEVERVNRAILVALWPGVISRVPLGSGVLLSDGNPSPAVLNPLLAPSQNRRAPWQVPWSAWWPTLRLWLGAALLLGLATLCMMLVVHCQWAHRELLPYPTVQVVNELTRSSPGAWLPDIAKSRLFWIGVGLVACLHTVDGLAAWLPGLPEITRQLNFNPLRALFPNASQAASSWAVFSPTIYPAVIGLGYLISTRVSTSVGLAPLLWTMLGAWMLQLGVPLENSQSVIGDNGTLLRFGAWFGMTLLILYYGRHYYTRLLWTSLGGRRSPQVPGYAPWAARVGVACAGGALWLLCHYGGMSWVTGSLMIAFFLMGMLVLARINVETGLFFLQAAWLPGVILAGYLGYQGLGPTSLFMLTMASLVLMADPRTALAPFVINALGMTEQIGDQSPRRTVWPIGAMVIVGMVVACVVTLTIQYNVGLSSDFWGNFLPIAAFTQLSHGIIQLKSQGALAQTALLHGLGHLTHAQPLSGVWMWSLLGLGLVVACALARLRLPWWPVHPALFLLWGTYPINRFGFSFLLAAAIKGSVVHVGGERAYNKYKPIMIGLIAGELLMILLWSGVGTIYYVLTGYAPVKYAVWPG